MTPHQTQPNTFDLNKNSLTIKMFASVLPLRVVLLQGLLVVIAIAIESFILHNKLSISRKTSVEYATSINLFSTIVGWLVFFFVQPFLSEDIKLQFIHYLFFHRLFIFGSNLFTLYFQLFLILILSFVFVAAMKTTGLSLLEKVLLGKAAASSNSPPSPDYPTRTYVRANVFRQETRKSTAIWEAHAASYSLILIILFLNHWLASV